ncbi:MAG TPA: ATP-binding cassette domain-containing protein, partial [Cyclobacteriaceae bacterium]|nr:ATP-binding cassette domain-containing protein [Cyclobacteriaceae bacterium]
MSEPVLKAILRLFAMVANEDDVTRHERDHVKAFLQEHLSHQSTDHYLSLFDEFSNQITTHSSKLEDVRKSIETLCAEISPELTQKQKIVIQLELIRIIVADGNATPQEEDLVNAIGSYFKISNEEIHSIKSFVTARQSEDLDKENVLVIDASMKVRSGRHIFRENLNGYLSVLYVRSSDLYFIHYNGGSDVYMNGVPLQPGTFSVLAVGSTLRWEHDDPIYFGDILTRFKSFGDHPRISFEARQISYKFRNGKLGLREINLLEESGNLIALMGASGAGKSTLLHVLNGSEKPSSGQVLINGIDIHHTPQAIEGVIGFVPQDDLLIEDLTVYQNLYYAAKLCFSDKSEQAIDELVMRVLTDLGLEETKDLKVGSPLRKTISGGQRKRLNIGLELLREPAVLFCDEPTSGLSSRDSENIIDLLKELSLKGKLVFAVIHQPSSDIFKMFDKLLILDTGGYQIYYGNPVDSVVYFKRSINLLNSNEGECHECGNVNPEQVFNIIEAKVINEYGHFTNERKVSAEQWNELYRKNYRPFSLSPSKAAPHSSLRIPDRLKQIWLFATRDVQAKIHNRQYMIINLVEAPVLAFILAFIVRYYNVDDLSVSTYTFGKNLNVPAYLFMSVIVALFMGLTVSAEEIIRDRKILKREAFLHLSRSSYILSKVLILFTLSAVQTGTFVLVGSYVLGINGMFINHWAILFTTSCFANLLGLNISSAFNSAVTIYILIPLLIIPQLILSGVVVKFDKLNPVIGNTVTVPFVGDLMASRWAFEAAMVTQFKDNAFEKEFYLYDKTIAGADFKMVYFITELETRLQYCLSNVNSINPAVRKNVEQYFQLLKTEIGEELVVLGRVLPEIDNLSVGKFDQHTYDSISEFLSTLKTFYINRYNRADELKEKKINEMTNSPQKVKAFQEFKTSYHNEAITDLVKNVIETNRIVEKNGKLVQKIYPIYKDPEPDHLVDFDAQFYMPSKHFLSRNVDTLIFNLGVIWSMILVLGLMLYFDV